MKLELSYTLIYRGTQYPLPAEGRKCEPTAEGKENRKVSLNGTIHQSFTRTNTKFPFSWEIVDFSFCSQIQDLYNAYNLHDEPLYMRRKKPSGEIGTFEVVMSQPKAKLNEIISEDEKWGSLELEVTSKQWQNLSF